VLRSGPVTRRRIEGAIAAYVLLGVTWAQAYEMVALAHAGAFAGRVDDTGGFTGWLYYSFVTLTTVGYGDIVPVHPIARSLAVLEALTGQLYPAILLARLVSLEVTSRSGGAR
jgi:voltage-gated potassium channel Kch